MLRILRFERLVAIGIWFGCLSLLIRSGSGDEWAVSNSTTPNDLTLNVTECREERECKAACGSAASDSRCNLDSGICVCLNEFGPSRRCRNVKHSEEECTAHCKRKIAQVCYTDFGKFCSCFVRN